VCAFFNKHLPLMELAQVEKFHTSNGALFSSVDDFHDLSRPWIVDLFFY